MKLPSALILPFLSLKSVYSISCYSDSAQSLPTVTCEDLNQNLAGLATIDWLSFGQINKLKLILNDDEPAVNENYISILEDTLRKLSGSVTELSLVHFNNAISNKILKKAPLLETLHISKTQVDSLPVRLFKDTKIDNFKIADSEIATINNQVFGSSNLRKLKLERNRLHSLPEDSFVHCTSLEHLDLSDNNIDSVHLDVMKHLVNLKKVDLDNNGLTFMPEDFFKKNKELRHLSLSGNSLTSLPCNLLKYQFGLTSLNITNNRFTSIPCHLISRQGEQLKSFDASNNFVHTRYGKDLSHKRGVAHTLNRKGMKANGKVRTEKDEDGEIEFAEGNDNQIGGTLDFVCDACDRLPPSKKLKKIERGTWEKFKPIDVDSNQL